MENFDKDDIKAKLILQKLDTKSRLLKELKTTNRFAGSIFMIAFFVCSVAFLQEWLEMLPFVIALVAYIEAGTFNTNRRIDALIKLLEIEKNVDK